MSDANAGRVRVVRVLLRAIAAFGLCAVLAFTVEPSTSTEADLHEGDGVAIVQSGTVSAKGVAGLQSLHQVLRTVLAAVAAIAVVLVATVRRRPLVDIAPSSPRDPARATAFTRRGPPAFAA